MSSQNEESLVELPVESLRKDPLWRHVVDKLVERGITYGDTIDVSWLEENLECLFASVKFQLSVSEIRHALIERGMYLSGSRTQRTGHYTVIQANQNAEVFDSMLEEQERLNQRALTLAVKTDRSKLTAEEGEALDARAERAAVRKVLMERQGAVEKVLRKHASHILKQPAGEAYA